LSSCQGQNESSGHHHSDLTWRGLESQDPWAEKLHDIEDVEKLLPGTLDVVREWFRTYKVPDGKPENKFAFDEKFMNRAFTLGVMHETHA
jgi:inorganic pyrophosphatase